MPSRPTSLLPTPRSPIFRRGSRSLLPPRRYVCFELRTKILELDTVPSYRQPTLELSPAEPIEEGGEIVLVNPDDFAPYVDPIENPEDFDPWWDYTTDHDVYPVRDMVMEWPSISWHSLGICHGMLTIFVFQHNLNRPPKPPTELHEAH